jgi:hypothetical protein
MRAPTERYCPLISGAKGAPRSCPAGSIAEVGFRWCGATPRNRMERNLSGIAAIRLSKLILMSP